MGRNALNTTGRAGTTDTHGWPDGPKRGCECGPSGRRFAIPAQRASSSNSLGQRPRNPASPHDHPGPTGRQFSNPRKIAKEILTADVADFTDKHNVTYAYHPRHPRSESCNWKDDGLRKAPNVLVQSFAQHKPVIPRKLTRVIARPQDEVVRFRDHHQFFIFPATRHGLFQLS